ncbi:MAG: Phosphogluconate dehydrogenase (Decarboxylating) NAD binding domain protein [Spirochaetes bacterium]|nr:MAG: Phosphogluconate dehydrogenase (Decarboxylating) NAD binding domain protein [Spirochaetota bacterium]
MGSSMAKNLAARGHSLTLYNRSHEKAAALAKATGMKTASTIAEAVKSNEYIFLMVGYPKDVEETFYSHGGVFESALPGTIVVDMTTSPSLAAKLHEDGKKRGLRVLDAPVSGGDSGARNATLSIMAGGDEKDFEAAKPLFEGLGKNITYLGPAGSGQHAKAANQIAVAGATAAYTEALAYARSVGLDPYKMLQAIGTGAAGSWQLANMAPRALQGDFAPGFYIKHFIKDMHIIDAEMSQRGLSLAVVKTVLSLYEKMAQKGLQDDGTQALIKLYSEK